MIFSRPRLTHPRYAETPRGRRRSHEYAPNKSVRLPRRGRGEYCSVFAIHTSQSNFKLFAVIRRIPMPDGAKKTVTLSDRQLSRLASVRQSDFVPLPSYSSSRQSTGTIASRASSLSPMITAESVAPHLRRYDRAALFICVLATVFKERFCATRCACDDDGLARR